MTKEELNAILENHRKWLAGNPDGVRAYLRGADLRDADLHGADLRDADLHGADLRDADLHGADLHGADLHDADLNGAYLRDADLHGADLHDADLCHAILRGADLSGANIDYSCWPLWSGSLGAKIDKRLACQLLYHTLRAMESVDDEEVQAACNNPDNIALANQFHRAGEGGELKSEK